jgi:hypothetical protein
MATDDVKKKKKRRVDLLVDRLGRRHVDLHSICG